MTRNGRNCGLPRLPDQVSGGDRTCVIDRVVLEQPRGTHLTKIRSILLLSAFILISPLASERATSLSLGEREVSVLFDVAHQVINAKISEIHGKCDDSTCTN